MHWEIDPVHTTIGFAAKHMMVTTVRGRFGRVKGAFDLDPEAPDKAQGRLIIDAKSVDTNMPMRDDHLRSPDFFDAERFPELTFRTTSVRQVGGTRYEVDGELTIRDVTRPVTLEADLSAVYPDPRGDRIGISLRGAIDRTAYGLRWNKALEAGGVMVGETIKIEAEVEAIANAEVLAA